MKNKKISFLILIVFIFVFQSCAQQKAIRSTPPPEEDKCYSQYPRYRIDNLVKNILIIGEGPGESTIKSSLVELFQRKNIKVIESGNLSAILGGGIISYGTGLSSADSKAIAQLLQVDHILFFEEYISPYKDYIYGGRAYEKLNIKIVNTRNGEVILQHSSSWGVKLNDPRSFGYSIQREITTTNIDYFRGANMWCNSGAYLAYAFGDFSVGIRTDKATNTLAEVRIDSPANRAGIQKGDKVIEINGIQVSNLFEVGNVLRNGGIKQGDTVKMKIVRGDKAKVFAVTIPSIPFYPNELLEKKDEDSVDSPGKLKIKKAI